MITLHLQSYCGVCGTAASCGQYYSQECVLVLLIDHVITEFALSITKRSPCFKTSSLSRPTATCRAEKHQYNTRYQPPNPSPALARHCVTLARQRMMVKYRPSPSVFALTLTNSSKWHTACLQMSRAILIRRRRIFGSFPTSHRNSAHFPFVYMEAQNEGSITMISGDGPGCTGARQVKEYSVCRVTMPEF